MWFQHETLLNSFDAGHFMSCLYLRVGPLQIGGVVLPNDGKCHMYNGMYTMDLEQDYPSLGQISRLAKEHSINVIFAVTQPLVNYYNQLSSHIKGSLVAELAGDSSNIVTLIEEQYKQISSSVEMRSTAPEGIHIRYYTSCLGQKMQENHQCSGNNTSFPLKMRVLRWLHRDERISDPLCRMNPFRFEGGRQNNLHR